MVLILVGVDIRGTNCGHNRRLTRDRKEWVPSLGLQTAEGHHKTLSWRNSVNQRGGAPEDEAGHGHGPNNGEVFHRIWTTKT